VYSFNAFFHFDPELVVHYVREIKRVLQPGGMGIIEFKGWTKKEDVTEFLDKIEHQGGIEVYEAELDKWRYVSSDMLVVLCDYYDLEVIDDDVSRFTFRKRSS